MASLQFEFGKLSNGLPTPAEWTWDETDIGAPNPNVDYQRMAKTLIQRMPESGPTSVMIKIDGRLVGAWSRFDER
jgi:hypothetical protein